MTSDRSTNDASDAEIGGLWTALGEICSGIATGSTHSYWFVKNLAGTHVIDPAIRMLSVLAGRGGGAIDGAAPPRRDGTSNPGLQVVGVGYGRTGTYSLTLALEALGYKTLHTQHMYETPEILDMFDSRVFTPSIQSGKATMGTPDFDLIESFGFAATADLPLSLYFDQILDRNPNVKFVLTTRQTSDIWFSSWDMLTKTITQPTRYFRWMNHADQINRYYRWLFATINGDDSYLTVPLPLPDQDRDRAIRSYEAHNRRVREMVPPDRLLEYNVKQGWEPLCQFLNVTECPSDVGTPFPRTNSARSVQVQTVSAMVIPLAVVLFVLFYVFAYGFRRVTGGRTVLEWSGDKRVEVLAALTGREMKKRNANNKEGGRRGRRGTRKVD